MHNNKDTFDNGPASTNLVGVGLRSDHIPHIAKNIKDISKKIGFFEVHSENYYNFHNTSFETIVEFRKTFPISLHCVGNSLGSVEKIDLNHLKKLKELADIIDPFLISDHISWAAIGGNNYNDLLPLPYTKEALKAISDNVSIAQDYLKREILVENPSAYLAFPNQEMDEAKFINKLTTKTGCKLLLDVNNIFVSAQNNNEFDPFEYLEKLDKNIVQEIHLAGHSESEIFDGKNHKKILIDTHDDLVCDEVWAIYKKAVAKFKSTPTLIEWDQNFPEFKVLLDEAEKAKEILYK